jgi:hypothetical protein
MLYLIAKNGWAGRSGLRGLGMNYLVSLEAGIVVSNPTRGLDVCVVCVYSTFVLFCMWVEALRGLIPRPRSPTDCV